MRGEGERHGWVVTRGAGARRRHDAMTGGPVTYTAPPSTSLHTCSTHPRPTSAVAGAAVAVATVGATAAGRDGGGAGGGVSVRDGGGGGGAGAATDGCPQPSTAPHGPYLTHTGEGV